VTLAGGHAFSLPRGSHVTLSMHHRGARFTTAPVAACEDPAFAGEFVLPFPGGLRDPEPLRIAVIAAEDRHGPGRLVGTHILDPRRAMVAPADGSNARRWWREWDRMEHVCFDCFFDKNLPSQEFSISFALIHDTHLLTHTHHTLSSAEPVPRGAWPRGAVVVADWRDQPAARCAARTGARTARR
jgi:hypothetical protein